MTFFWNLIFFIVEENANFVYFIEHNLVCGNNVTDRHEHAFSVCQGNWEQPKILSILRTDTFLARHIIGILTKTLVSI